MKHRNVPDRPIVGITCFSLTVPMARSAVQQRYIEAVEVAGGTPILIPLGIGEETRDQIYSMIDALLLPGGDDVAPERYGHSPHPNLGNVDVPRDELELPLTVRAFEDDLPILGICRGIQVMAVAAGGTLVQDLPAQWGTEIRHEVREFGRDYLTHDITIEPGSRLAAILGCTTARVNSFHHQAVQNVPRGFQVVGSASDGVVEAMEAPGDRFAVGLQCHPEEIYATTAPEFSRLFRAFIEAAREHALDLRTSA